MFVLNLKFRVRVLRIYPTVILYHLLSYCKPTTNFSHKKIFLLKLSFYICLIKL